LLIDQKNRELSTTPYGSNWVISGNATHEKLEKGETYLVTLTAKDSSGLRIATGGANFVIRIYNECTADPYFGCVENSGAKQIVSSTIFSTMGDNGDGSYSYTFVALEQGSVVIKILHANEGIDSRFYTNRFYTEPPEIHNVTYDINYNWRRGSPVSVIDFFSSVLDFYFVPEESTDYTFKLNADDVSYLYVNGTQIVKSFNNISYTVVSSIDNIIIANIDESI
jgi:hypothetical protein